MPTKKANLPMDFLVAELKKNRKASYADIKAKANAKKLQLYPIMFGRAQAMLGIVKSAKRGTGKFAMARKASRPGPGRPRGGGPSKTDAVRALLARGMSAADIAKKVGCTTGLVYNVKSTMGRGAKRGPGRPRKAGAGASLNGIESILAVVQNAERERVQLRAALERIQSIVHATL